MKNNQVIMVMAGIFFVCSLVTFFNVWNYRASMQQLNEWEGRANYVRYLNPIMVSLVNDTTEYSKKNPAVIPVLQSLTNGLSHAAAAAQKSATK